MSRILKAASGIAIVTLGSRILGLVRDVVMFRVLGASWAMGAFVLAWTFPNMLRRLFGEGALSAAFVPVYARSVQSDAGDSSASRALLGAVVSLLLTMLVALSLIVLVVSFVLPAELVGAGSDEDAERHGNLLLGLVGVLFPYSIPICLLAVLAGALNCHGKFALPAAAPILLNLMWIAGISVGAAVSDDLGTIVGVLSWFLLAAGFLQLTLALWPLMRLGRGPKLVAPGRALASAPASREVLRNMAPAVLGMSLVQFNAVIDHAMATYLIGPDAPSYLFMANRLLLFPHAIVGLALATAVYPALANHAIREERAALRDKLEETLLQTTVLALPACVGMMLVADPLIRVVFEHGRFTAGDSDISAATTICLVAALPAIGSAQLHARALFALGDTRSPAVIAVWLLFTNIALNVFLVQVLDLETPGLAMATTLCAIANHFLLRQRLRVLCPTAPTRTRNVMPALLGTVVMGLLVWASQEFLSTSSDDRVAQALQNLALPIGVGVLGYSITYRMLAGTWRIR